MHLIKNYHRWSNNLNKFFQCAKISVSFLSSGENIRGQTLIALKSYERVALLTVSTDILSSL